MEPFEEKLILLVSEHDFLYSTKSRSYKNVLKRDSTWVRIAEQLGKPVDECRQRWRSLRDRFVREKRKLQQPSGSGATEVDVWEYYNALEFLNEAVKPRKLQVGNYQCFTDSPEAAQFSPTDDSSYIFPECSTPEPIQRQPAKRSKPLDAPMMEFFGDLSKTLSERFKTEDPDENDMFMNMLAKKMKILSQDAKNRLQEKFLKEVNLEILANSGST